MPTRPARILVVSNEVPGQSGTGLRIRLYHTVLALAEAGAVDLVAAFDPTWRDAAPLPANLAVGQVQLLPIRVNGAAGDGAARDSAAGGGGRLPREISHRQYDLARRELAPWAASPVIPYDLVWLSRVESYLSYGPVRSPSVLDLDDIEHQKVLGRWRAERRPPHPPAGAARLTAWTALSEASRWRRLQIDAARQVDQAVVSSELSVTQLPLTRPAVIPNGYELLAPLPPVAAGQSSPRSPTITLPGFLRYGPNADAADLLVQRVLPHIRRQLPDIRVRLVGEPDARVARLHDPPWVTVTGRVADIRAKQCHRSDRGTAAMGQRHQDQDP